MRKIKNRLYIAVAAILALSFFVPDLVGATGVLSPAEVRLGRLAEGASANNDMMVVFKLNDAPTTVTQVVITVPSGFNVTAAAATNVPVFTFPATPASITAMPTSTHIQYTATSNGSNLGGTVTITGMTTASLNSTTLYGTDVPTGVITNPGTANQYMFTVASETSGNAVVDTTGVPVYIYGSSTTADQVNVTASVAPNFSFSLSANADTIPQVSPTTITTSGGVNMVVGTNSPLGYTAYVASTNNSLISPSTSTPIPTGTFSLTTPTSMTAGTSDYGFVPSTGAAASIFSGTISYNPEYTIVGNESGPFAGANTFAAFESRNGYTNADTIDLQERVAVGTTVGYANDYADTLTIVAAGNF